ncbi:MAG: TM2 domain-containing protein [Bacteroidaceae bacterium]|nr:TM2 domain-containing protein [Bacteroidaceae bacterium]
MKADNEKYCVECGQIINSKAVVCPHCGCAQPRMNNGDGTDFDDKDNGEHKIKELNSRWIITVILAIVIGGFGAHRFYTGKIGTGILMLITCGGCGIWYLIDIFTVCTEQYTDSDGNRILMYI